MFLRRLYAIANILALCAIYLLLAPLCFGQSDATSCMNMGMMGRMAGPWGIVFGIMGLLLYAAIIAALLALVVFLVRRSRALHSH